MKKFWMIMIVFVVSGFYGGTSLISLPVARAALAGSGEKLAYIDLINRLTDLEQLAILPTPGEKCQQWSSYDRASKYDKASGKYVGWFANGDGNGIIRKEGDTQVFAEMEGPGVIWRIWSALANKGHVKIYLDGAAEPAVDLPFIGYFNRENEPFTHEALVHMTARGQNCYIPIPYQKSCKIVGQGDWGRYYHFTYTTYPKGTVLPTFKRQLSAAESKALDKAAKILTRGRLPGGKRQGQVTIKGEPLMVAPGATATVARLKGERAIIILQAYIIDLPESPDDRDVLRELALRISWDGESKPSVWVPLGDFFGTAPGVNIYKSLPLGMRGHGLFYSFWYMPFENGALIELTNDGDEERQVAFSITHAPVTQPIEKLGRFHAKWHRDAFLPEEPGRDASPHCIDWTMLKTEGRGRFCGVMLHVWNPRGGWWGEGDEKFFVDGEKFPSTIGTGSEDYFGYAWCNPTLFQNCYHNQTISMNNKGHVSVNRWHVTDNIPFQKSFEAAIEKYYPNGKPTLYAATSYWYQAAGQTDAYKPVPVAQRLGYWGPIKVFRVKGALEGEKLKVLS
ncbi:MAG: glycoside hydrolase family 172 protein, partial [Planctomycetota bacterium]